jgi:hypothetical protein
MLACMEQPKADWSKGYLGQLLGGR